MRALFAAALIGPLVIGGAHAQELTGTLKKIKDSKTVTLGYRESSIPFSYLNRPGDPIGYSIDLCNAVVDETSKEIGGLETAVKYKKVTAETRIPAVRSGEIDLECGSTTANFERKKEVAFSPIFLMQLEGLGFCDFGEAKHFISDGHLGLKGSLPSNTNGGLIGEGTSPVRMIRSDLCAFSGSATTVADSSALVYG